MGLDWGWAWEWGMRFGQFVRLWGLAWRSFGACVTEGFGDFDCFGLGFGAGLGLGLRPWSGEWGKLKVADTSLHVDLRGELGVVVVLV